MTSGADIVRLLTDGEEGKAYFGHSPIVQTRSGIRFPTVVSPRSARDGTLETHRDQCLATLAELGIPLSHAMRIGEETFCLEDVLRDSLANFHLGQRELAWTAVAYALYLHSHRSWTNRFGEVYTFDTLVNELIQRPLDGASCAGTHLLYCLTILARADEQSSILSDDVRSRLWRRLRQCVKAAIGTQQAGGYWLLSWNRSLLHDSRQDGWSPDTARLSGRLLVTGHIAEWMLYLPNDLQVDDHVLRAAGQWLYTQLRSTTHRDQSELICPYAHAACVARQLTFVRENVPSPN